MVFKAKDSYLDDCVVAPLGSSYSDIRYTMFIYTYDRTSSVHANP